MSRLDKRVFITRKIVSDGQNLLEQNGIKVDVWQEDYPIPKAELSKLASNYDGLITMLTDSIDRDFIAANSHLEIISNYAVGFNNIDLDSASEFKIKIANTPDVLTEATAEIALGLMISLSREFFSAAQRAKNGDWKGWHPLENLTMGLNDKTLGIIGFGRIGQKLAQMASAAFNMKIIYFSRNEVENLIGAKKVELHEVFKNSDFISVHLPLNHETKNFIGLDLLQLMKKNSFLINTARGEIIKQNDLISHLEQNLIAGAGLDVTDPEPLEISSKLFHLKNVIVLPHIGSATIEARKKMSIMCAQNVISAFKNEAFIGWVNKKTSIHRGRIK